MSNDTPTAQSGPSDRAIAQAFREAMEQQIPFINSPYPWIEKRAAEIDRSTPPAGASDAVTGEMVERALNAWYGTEPGPHVEAWQLVHMRDALEAGKADGGDAATDKVVSEAVSRFLAWRLPDDFAPDCGISFKPITNPAWTHDLWPTGTNLLHAGQARAMFEHCLKATQPAATGGETT